jgi:hypothetical protein
LNHVNPLLISLHDNIQLEDAIEMYPLGVFLLVDVHDSVALRDVPNEVEVWYLWRKTSELYPLNWERPESELGDKFVEIR